MTHNWKYMFTLFGQRLSFYLVMKKYSHGGFNNHFNKINQYNNYTCMNLNSLRDKITFT